MRRSSRIQRLSQSSQPMHLGARLSQSQINHGSNRRNNDSDSDNQSSDYENSSNSSVYSNKENSNNNNNHNNNNNNNNNNIMSQQPNKRRKLTLNKHQKVWLNPAFNDPKKRRKVRCSYRKLTDDTIRNRALIADPLSNAFSQKLEEQQNIYQHANHPQEAHLDIQQSSYMSSILVEQTRLLANEQFAITPRDYIQALKRKFALRPNQQNNNNDIDFDNDDEAVDIDFAKLGQFMASYFLTVPQISFLNGPLQQSMGPIEQKKKKERIIRKRKKFDSDQPQTQPTNITKTKASDKTETSTRVARLLQTIRKACHKKKNDNSNNRKNSKSVNAIEFLVNPLSYSQTVENFFDLSFVIKEGRSQMDINPNTSQPQLTYISNVEKARRKEANQMSNGQCIIKIDPSYYLSMINTFNITESQIDREVELSDADSDFDIEVDEENDEKNKNQNKNKNKNNQESKNESDEEDDDDDDDEDDEDEDEDYDDNEDYEYVAPRKQSRARGRGHGRNRRSDKEEAD